MERKELGPNQPIITPKRLKLLEMMEKGKVDRISAVPDCLLLEILSRLPSTKDAIRTGTLSKRWKHLWTLVPTLIFKHDDRNLPWSNFASFVDKTLTQCRQLKLKKFKLYIRCHSRALCQVNTWIHDVIRYNVEELNLNLKGWDIEDEFWLDQYLIINTCLTDLTLEGGIFNALGAISWKKLKRLCISHAFIDGALIENISSGSPLLETLDLNDCSGLRRLDITSKSVKNLVLDDNIGWALDFVEIKAPNILSLTIKGRMYLEKLSLVNLSSLVEANLNYYHTNDKMPKEAEEEMLKGLILNLRHVKIFKIGSSCSKVLLRLEAKGFVIPSNVKIADGFYKRLEFGDA